MVRDLDLAGEIPTPPEPRVPYHPIKPKPLPERFRMGQKEPFKTDDFSILYPETVDLKRYITSQNIRRIDDHNRALDKPVETTKADGEKESEITPKRRLEWVCVSGYLQDMEGLARKFKKDTRRRYRDWGVGEFADRIGEVLDERPDEVIVPVRRERKDGDKSDEFEIWVMNVSAEEIEAIKEQFETPVEGEVRGERLAASVGISASTDPEIQEIISDSVKRLQPDDVLLPRLRRENLLHRLDRELKIDGSHLSEHDREILRRIIKHLREDDDRKLTMSTARLTAEQEMAIEEKDRELAKLHGEGELERRPNSRFHTDISHYMKEGHAEHSARSLVYKDVMRKKKEEELGELANIDPLTGLRNRRWLRNNLSEIIEHTRNSGLSLSLVIIDVDRFKEINDTYGHFLGDEVLRRITSTFRLRSDYAVRLGGDEFALILFGAAFLGPTTGASASFVVERLFSDINKPTLWKDLGFQPTISMGVVEHTDEIGDDFLDHGDKALYKAKEAGRNQAYLYKKSEKGRPQFSKVEVSPGS